MLAPANCVTFAYGIGTWWDRYILGHFIEGLTEELRLVICNVLGLFILHIRAHDYE